MAWRPAAVRATNVDDEDGGVVWKAFQRTGCGVAIDGWGMDRISPINVRNSDKWTGFDPTKVVPRPAAAPQFKFKLGLPMTCDM